MEGRKDSKWIQEFHDYRDRVLLSTAPPISQEKEKPNGKDK